MKKDQSPISKKSFWAVIPANVRYCEKLEASAKLLYGEVSALCNEKGFCYASNRYFSELYKVDERTIRRWLQSLEAQGFVYARVEGKSRKIFLAESLRFNMSDLKGMPEPVEDEAETSAAEPTAKTKKTSKAVSTKFTDQDLEMAEFLHSKILINFPAYENKKVKISEWADDMRKLREIDKATSEQVRFMIAWIHGGDVVRAGRANLTLEPNDFWSKNILSASKLRKQWFNLVPQLQSALKAKVKTHAVAQL